MAIKSLVPDGKYGVCETPSLTARKIGGSLVKNQFALDATDFATIAAQNGMLLVVNEFDGTIDLPANANSYVYLHNSPVKDYEELGKEKVAVKRGELLPVMYKLTVGDTIITNTLKYDDDVYADVAAIVDAIDATTVYGVPNADGYIRLGAAAAGTETVVLKAKEVTTLSNGRTAIKFIVEKA